MGRKGPRAKTKTVLKTVSIVDQLGIMPNSKFQTFLNKNHPIVLCRFVPGTFGYEIGQNVSLLYFPDDLAFDRQDNDTSPNSCVSDQKLVFDLRWQGLKIWLRWERFASTAV